MPAWINLITDDLRDTKASALIDAFQTAALGDDQTDPVPRAIEKVCDRIRAEIQSSGKYTVSATPHAIPPSLFDLACNLIAWRMQGRINVAESMPVSDQDKIDHADDLRYLQRIANGDVTIETPDNPESTIGVETQTTLVEAIGDRPFQCSRETMRSL